MCSVLAHRRGEARGSPARACRDRPASRLLGDIDVGFENGWGEAREAGGTPKVRWVQPEVHHVPSVSQQTPGKSRWPTQTSSQHMMKIKEEEKATLTRADMVHGVNK